MNPLAKYATLIEAIAVATVLAGCAWGVHLFLEHERDIGRNEVRAEYAAQALKDTAAARLKEAADAKQKETAENERTLQAQRIDALAAALATTSGSLRSTSDGAIRNLSSATAETARATAAAFAGVFGDCTARYADVAKKADGHAADVRLLQAAP